MKSLEDAACILREVNKVTIASSNPEKTTVDDDDVPVSRAFDNGSVGNNRSQVLLTMPVWLNRSEPRLWSTVCRVEACEVLDQILRMSLTSCLRRLWYWLLQQPQAVCFQAWCIDNGMRRRWISKGALIIDV